MKERIVQDKYAKAHNCTRVALADIAPGDWVLFAGTGMRVVERNGNVVICNDIGWNDHSKYTVDGMIARKMKAYRGYKMRGED